MKLKDGTIVDSDGNDLVKKQLCEFEKELLEQGLLQERASFIPEFIKREEEWREIERKNRQIEAENRVRTIIAEQAQIDSLKLSKQNYKLNKLMAIGVLVSIVIGLISIVIGFYSVTQKQEYVDKRFQQSQKRLKLDTKHLTDEFSGSPYLIWDNNIWCNY